MMDEARQTLPLPGLSSSAFRQRSNRCGVRAHVSKHPQETQDVELASASLAGSLFVPWSEVGVRGFIAEPVRGGNLLAPHDSIPIPRSTIRF